MNSDSDSEKSSDASELETSSEDCIFNLSDLLSDDEYQEQRSEMKVISIAVHSLHLNNNKCMDACMYVYNICNNLKLNLINILYHKSIIILYMYIYYTGDSEDEPLFAGSTLTKNSSCLLFQQLILYKYSPFKSNSLDSKFCLCQNVLLSPAEILYKPIQKI